MRSRIGVDIGGTFTDLIYFNGSSGAVEATKVLSTPEAPELAVLNAVDDAVSAEALREAEYFLHGQTVGLNSLLTRSGSRVAIITTAGFRDVLEKRRGDYGNKYDVTWHPEEPLVPRRLRFGITERIDAAGDVVTPLDPSDVAEAVSCCRQEGVEAVAVCLINAYTNPAHELEVERLVRAAGFGGEVVLSHTVSGEYREYERTTTTVIDAYLRARVVGYLMRLETALRDRGFDGELLLTRSGGGALTFAQARSRPFETITSGPVAGANGAGEIATQLGIDELIAADVGGTSFDTALISQGRARLLFEGQVLGLPLQTPWVDVRSIGAGGGSIHWVDRGGLLRVGPQSAGASPGPASYGRGGTLATITDAAVVLGMLGETPLAGAVTIDREAAVAAFAALSSQLELSVEAVARGGMLIATTMMAGAIRAITAESGLDPRTCALMTYGGAGGLFATLLADELQIDRVIVPRFPGNFSAWGLLHSDVVRSAARTRLLRLDDVSLDSAGGVLLELFGALGEDTRESGSDLEYEAALDLRYLGQEHSLTVPVTWRDDRVADDAGDVRDAFTVAYRHLFGHTMDETVEMVTMRASARRRLTATAEQSAEPAGGHQRGERPVYSFRDQGWVDAAVIERGLLTPGEPISGPMIVAEPTSTTYVDVDFTVDVGRNGALVIERSTR